MSRTSRIIAAAALLLATASARGQENIDARAADAIGRGIEWVRRQQARDGSWAFSAYGHNHRLGMTALAGLALLENGVEADDPAIRDAEAAAVELAYGSQLTYDVALSILFLSRVQDGTQGRHDDLIVRLARRLEGGSRDGRWGYEVPRESLDSSSRSGRWRRGPGDNSNTQFALLGVWAGGRRGFDSNRSLAALDEHFRSTINRDGGWGYRDREPSRPGLTCAGLLALAIAEARPERAEQASSRARGAQLAADPVFRDALAAVTEVARSIGRNSKVYDLWSLERVCVALGLRELDGVDWYAGGAEVLLARQLPNGSWPYGDWGSLPETCLALLFLRKANLAFELDRVLKLPDPDAEDRPDSPPPTDPPGEAAATSGDDDVRVTVRQVDESGFPEITLDFEVKRPDGSPVLDATVEEFRVTEYDEAVEILRFLAPTAVETRPTTVVLVVDRSRSMADEGRMEALKQAVSTFLDVVPEGSRVGVVAFGSEVEVLQPFTTDDEAVRAAVAPLRPAGATRYYDAVVEALELLEGESGRQAVLALTDGEDTFSQVADLDSAILAARRAGLPVHTLGLGTEQEIASDDLRRLAAESRGQYFRAQEADQLRGIYEEIATRLGESYSLTYRTDRPLPDGTLRPVKIYYRAAAEAAGEAAVFIRGMVVPASGWSRLFLALVAVLVGLMLLPGMLGRRGAASGG